MSNVALISLSTKLPRSAKKPLSDWRPLLPHFVAGQENRLTAFACRNELSIVHCGNPLLIVGPSGVGKSAIARKLFADEIGRRNSESGVIETAIDFARRYAEAVDTDDINRFRQHYRSADVLLLEDVHLISEKQPAQEELASRISERVDCDLPTIVTCLRLPTEITGLRPGLASRLLPGLTIPIVPPESVARRQLIEQFLQQTDLSFDEDFVGYLDQKLPGDLPAGRLRAAVQQLAISSRSESAVTIEKNDVDRLVCSFSDQVEPSINDIAKIVAKQFQVKTAELKSKSRLQRVVRARSMAMFFARQKTSQSLQAIGLFFGGRDHSTVIHAIRSTEELIRSDGATASTATSISDCLS